MEKGIYRTKRCSIFVDISVPRDKEHGALLTIVYCYKHGTTSTTRRAGELKITDFQ